MSTWMILRGVKTCMTGTMPEPERNKNALPRVTHNSGGAGAPEQACASGGGPHSSSSPGLHGSGFAIARRCVRDKGIEQLMHNAIHLIDGAVERDLISFGGPAEAAELANELQGGCAGFPSVAGGLKLCSVLMLRHILFPLSPNILRRLFKTHPGAQPAG